MKIIFLGDIAVDNDVDISVDLSQWIAQADVVVANLEGVPLTSSSVSTFKTYGSIIYNDLHALNKLLDQLNITHASIYNNHMLDYGFSAVQSTIDFLDQRDITILQALNSVNVNATEQSLINCGLAEVFGLSPASKNFGINVNDLLFETADNINLSDDIIYAHFGIEMVEGLSQYEYNWFNYITMRRPKIVVRHHPHCIQKPFQLNGVPCFPSIGDFAFNFKAKKTSYGLAVMLDTVLNSITYREIKCCDYMINCGDVYHSLVKISHQFYSP